MTSFTKQGFYGGAIEGIIPEGWLDASDLREVPDHQEVFLSATNLSNLILEINQRVDSPEALGSLSSHNHPDDRDRLDISAPPGGTGIPATAETVDKAAALYHVHDLCDEGDAVRIVVPPTKVSVSRFSDSQNARAYRGVVLFTSVKQRRTGGGTAGGREQAQAHAQGSVDGLGSGTATAGSSADGPQVTKVSCHYLLVRLEEQGTDLLVFLNVPHEEFEAQGDLRALSREEALATETIEKMMEALEIKDWGLFV